MRRAVCGPGGRRPSPPGFCSDRRTQINRPLLLVLYRLKNCADFERIHTCPPYSLRCSLDGEHRLAIQSDVENYDMETKSMVAELDRRFGIPGVAKVCEGKGAMPRVHITSSLCEGEIYLHGAQVTSWKPAGAEELLFLSTKSRWEEGQAIRGGIPICFPWFRAKADDPQAPSHGFVRTTTWQIESIVENGSGVTVTMFTRSDCLLYTSRCV